MTELFKTDFAEVFEAYYDRIYKYAYTILLNRENAEDVVEETFLAAYIAYNSNLLSPNEGLACI